MNLITVTVAKLAQPQTDVPLRAGTDVQTALGQAGLSGEGQVMVNGREVSDDEILQNGDTVVVVPQVRGGNC